MCSSSDATEATLVSSVGTTTMVRALSGTRSEKSRRDSRRGGIAQAITRWASAIATSAAGISSRAMTRAIARGEAASWRAYDTAEASRTTVIAAIAPR